MSTATPQPFLPPDILLIVIDCLIASSLLSSIALPPFHPTTQTLLSLTRTSRTTYPTARRLLYSQCLYIDSAKRLNGLLFSLSPHPAELTSIQPCILPPTAIHQHITSLYLSPFPRTSLSSLQTATSLCALFTIIAPTLRRLIIDIPLRSLYPSADHERVRPLLRRAFQQLLALELFCSVRDELYLDCEEEEESRKEPFVWAQWPQLRTLALYNADASAARFWEGLGRLRYLENLVLTRCDGLEEVDVKREWERHCGDAERGLCVSLVNVESEHRVPLGKATWKEEDVVTVREVNVPLSYYGDEDEIELCQEWVKRRLLRGESIE